MSIKISVIITGIVIVIIAGIVYYKIGANTPSITPEAVPAQNPVTIPASEPTPVPTPKPASAPTPVKAVPKQYTVTIQNFAFNPATINIKEGDTVTWVNKDSVGHTATGDNGGPDSPLLNTDQSYSFKFTATGTFSYYCKPHPRMKGSVIVTK